MTTVAVAFNDEDRKFLEEAVGSGRYVLVSEVVAEALCGLKMREAMHRAK